jgi:hypothetical protein
MLLLSPIVRWRVSAIKSPTPSASRNCPIPSSPRPAAVQRIWNTPLQFQLDLHHGTMVVPSSGAEKSLPKLLFHIYSLMCVVACTRCVYQRFRRETKEGDEVWVGFNGFSYLKENSINDNVDTMIHACCIYHTHYSSHCLTNKV